MDVQSAPPEREALEVDAQYLNLAALNKGVTLRLADPLILGEGNVAGNLFVCSNRQGLVIVGDNQGFCLFSLGTIRSAFLTATPHSVPQVLPQLQVPIPNKIDFIRLASSEKLVVVGMNNGSIVVWDLQRLAGGDISPLNGFPNTIPLIDLLPCPAPDSPLLVVLTATSLAVVSLSTFQPLVFFPTHLNITAACWSVKGKQIVVGMRGGGMAQFTPEGEKKAEIAAPVSLQGAGWDVRSIHWLENNVFLVTYAKPNSPGTQPLHDDEVYIITKDAAGGVREYTKFNDPAPAFGMMERPGRRWIANLKAWKPLKHLLFMANAPSADIGAIGQAEDSSWVSLSLPDTCRPSIPLTELDSSDTCTLGLELDLASDGPRLMVFTSDGVLAVWRIENDLGGDYTTAQEAAVGKTTSFASPFTIPAAFAAPPPPPAVAATAFPTTAFGATPAFGASAFGSSSFGSSGFSAKPSTGGFSGFGTPAPVATTTTAPTGFGTPSAGGFSSFGSAVTAPGSTSAFGAFGASKPTAFGATGVDSNTTKSTWGSGSSFAPSPAFGTPSAKASAFGTSTTPSTSAAFAPVTNAFGSKATFGTAPPASFSSFSTPSTGTNAFASSPSSPFGSSTPSAFGSKPATFGTSTTSGFAGFGPSATVLGTTRQGQVEEEEEEEEMEAVEEVRGDDPPDLEPTRTGLAFGEGVLDRNLSPSSSMGGGTASLGFGGLGLATSSTTVIAPVGGGIFGPQPVLVAEVKTATVGFGFGATTFPAAPVISAFGSTSAFGSSSTFGSTTSPFGTSTTASAFGSSTTSAFGIPAKSAFGSSTSGFGSVPSISTVPAIEPINQLGSAISITEITTPSISPAPSPPISSTPPPVSNTTNNTATSTTPLAAPTAITVAPVTASTKSLFGFASSPPSSSKNLSRGGSISQVVESDSQRTFTEEGEEEEEEEEEEYSEEEEEIREEGEFSGEEEEGEEYDEDALYDEEERTAPLRDHSREQEDSLEEEEEEEEEGEEEEKIEAPAIKPNRVERGENPLLARLDAQVKIESTSSAIITPVESKSTTPTISLVSTPIPSPFLAPVASPVSISSNAPSPFTSSLPVTTKPVAEVISPPLVSKPTLGGAIPNKPFFGFNNSATPRSSSPLSFGSAPIQPPIAIPSAFSFSKPTTVITPPIQKPTFIPGAFNSLPPTAIPLPPSGPSTPAISSASSSFTLPAAVTFKPTPVSNAIAPDRNGVPLSTTSTPKLSGLVSNGKSIEVKETGLTGEFLKTYQILEEEFTVLKKNTIICQAFVKEIKIACQTKGNQNDFNDSHWSLGDLERLKEITLEIEPKIESLVEIAIGQKRQVVELQSLMLKAETKREEAARFIRAKSDPIFAKMVRVRQLGPEQVETQKNLRMAVQTANNRLEQLEDHIMLVKDKIMEDRLGKSSFKTPSLDAVNRTVHNISTAVIEKTTEIDELSLRLNMLRVNAASNSTPKTSTPQKSSRHRSPSIDDTLGASTLGSSPGIKAAPILNPNVIATANASLLAERNVGILKRALLSIRTKPLLNRGACEKVTKSQFSDLQTAFSAGPITGNNLPLPRREVTPPLPTTLPVFDSLASSSSTLPPSWSFNNPSTPTQTSNLGIKAPNFIAFNPPTSPTSPTTFTTPSTLNSTRGAPSRTSRIHSSSAHSSALLLKTTNAYNKSFVSPSSTTFDWGNLPTPPTLPSGNLLKTREFISFDGLQIPEVVKIEPILSKGERTDDSEEEEEGEEGIEFGEEEENGWDEEESEEEFGGEGLVESLDDIAEETEEE